SENTLGDVRRSGLVALYWQGRKGVQQMPKIKTLVRQLLEEHQIKKPPVPVEDLAKGVGAEIRYSPFEGDVSGMLFRHQNQKIIGVNSLHHLHRQRFTIAHEIAHLLLHEGMEVHVDHSYRLNLRDDVSSQALDPEEIAANK